MWYEDNLEYIFQVIDSKNKEYYIKTPSEFPELTSSLDFYEPMMLASLIFPKEYCGSIIELCQVNSQ
jgi:translation elongation factor EF-4